MRTVSPVAPLTQADVLAALRDCYDPDIPANIVELGMVHFVSVAPDPDAPGAGIPGVPPRYRVHIALTPSSPGSATEAQVLAQIQNRLAAFESISNTDVELIWEPRWTPDRISPAASARLNLKSRSPNGLIQIQTQNSKT